MPHKRTNKYLIRSNGSIIYKNQYGFTLVEMLIAVSLSLIIMSGVYKVFISQNKAYTVQDQVTEMQQNARVAMDMMTREIRMAGYLAEEWITGASPPSPPTHDIVNVSDFNDPFIQGGPTENEDIEESLTNAITFEGDINYTGDSGDRTEMVRYSLNANSTLVRETWTWDGVSQWGNSGGPQPVAENIHELVLNYYKDDGSEATNRADIRLIKIKITARTAREDSGYTGGIDLNSNLNDGTARTRVLTARVKPRNLGL